MIRNRPTLLYFQESLIVLIFLLISISCGSSISNAVANKSEQFTNEAGGYSFEYPSGWKAFSMPNGQHGEKEVTGIIVMTNQDSPNIYIRQTDKSNVTLEEAIEWGERRILERYGEVGIPQFDPPTYSETNGMEIAKRIYMISFPGRDTALKNQDVYFATSNNIYVVTFSSTAENYDNYIRVFDKIMSSFQIIQIP